ncbi:hypothetical protein E2C01_054293 [Portunus trituberculatus]|uniref:Uncharacterized protein n=1 Tax=Portunus trituberculatus TaxID=210409 RepID=A0A5B7GUL2_PORTR|nr:hypothetical protein [Portunus trituberculatus]
MSSPTLRWRPSGKTNRTPPPLERGPSRRPRSGRLGSHQVESRRLGSQNGLNGLVGQKNRMEGVLVGDTMNQRSWSVLKGCLP